MQAAKTRARRGGPLEAGCWKWTSTGAGGGGVAFSGREGAGIALGWGDREWWRKQWASSSVGASLPCAHVRVMKTTEPEREGCKRAIVPSGCSGRRVLVLAGV